MNVLHENGKQMENAECEEREWAVKERGKQRVGKSAFYESDIIILGKIILSHLNILIMIILAK